jgi:superfamily II RNA helicase
MGNVDEIRGWMEHIHGPTALVSNAVRPVPLRYIFATRQGFYPLFRHPDAGPGAPLDVTKVRFFS